MTKIRITVSVALAALALSACAQSGTDGSPNEPGGPVPSSSAPQPGPVEPSTGPVNPTVDPTPGPTAPPTRPGGPPSSGRLTLTGVITSGVEPGCVLLDNFLLLGGPRDLLAAGARVTVTGRVEPGLMSTCQQGTPFLVESVQRS